MRVFSAQGKQHRAVVPLSLVMASTEGAAASGDADSAAGSSQASARSESKGKYDIANHLTENELREFKEIFSLVDTDGGGTISATELSDLMETLGIRASDEEIEAMIEEIDADGSGDIDFNEFVAVMSRKVETKYTADEVKAAFKIFEGAAPKDHIRVTDLVDSLLRFGEKPLTKEQAQDLVGQLEADGNGLVNYVDFVNMMLTK